MATDVQVTGTNTKALFTLKVHRGDGMALLAMNWRKGQPPDDFVGFAIEYREPGGDRFYALNNRLGFLRADGTVDPKALQHRHPITPYARRALQGRVVRTMLRGKTVYEAGTFSPPEGRWLRRTR